MTKAIAVVAHHDDALLWVGGTIKRTRCMGWDWTVLASCVVGDAFKKYFEELCEDLRVRPVCLSYSAHQYGDLYPPSGSPDEMYSDILEVVQPAEFAWVFTHNEAGEYGPHANHKETALIVARLVTEGIVSGSQVANFAYGTIYNLGGLAPAARVEASHYLQLRYEELSWKAEWCAKAPDVGTSLTNLGLPCPNPEAFVCASPRLPSPFLAR